MTPGLESCHALVLNADFRPLSYFPLSIWSWQDAVKAVFLDRVSVISEYERKIHSPSFEMRLPSVIALKEYVPAARRPAFTRFNVFLRDRFNCQYCGGDFATNELTFDHVVPKSRGGRTAWRSRFFRQIWIEALEDRTLLSAYQWLGGSSANWNDPGNWTLLSGSGTFPRSARRAFSLGSTSPALTALFSTSTISAGVLRGAPIP